MTKSPIRNCLVCGAENNHGNHFDVQCCRACAIFFRRRAGSKYADLKCQTRHCDEKYKLCKPCRLRRCYAVGMNIEKFQHNRDSLKTLEKLPQSFTNFIGRPSLVIFCIPEEPYEKTFVELKDLLKKASEILHFGAETPYVGPSQLRKLTMASCFSISKDCRMYRTLSYGDMSYFWEYYLLRTAKWLTYFEEFQSIPHKMKLQLLTSFWHVFGRLDKMVTTASARRKKICNNEKMWAMSNGVIMDLNYTKVDFSAISKYPLEQILYFLNSITIFDLSTEIDKLVQLNVSDVEFNFMLAQLMFSYAGKRFQGDIMKICDRFQEVLSNDLHNYYVNEKKMPRYSTRLSQIMQINNAIQVRSHCSHYCFFSLFQNDIWRNRPRGELAAIFNVFTVKFSHPEMFVDTGLV
ncbi:CRE-NHR-90 protein [Caenorhabditis remanei]|uniref:CRE-NHR-90 protein n=1 Tax=Caenorhabditis remanei TaxID=31234 RepID=E3LL97_CAERE|nr:CRE-NHR-90 protein [Caenorhabditis remanei]